MKQGEEGVMKREEAAGRCYPAQSVRTREVLVSGNDGSARRDEAGTSAAIGICSSYVREQRLMLGGRKQPESHAIDLQVSAHERA